MALFENVLIANRGEIACRIARTCKRLGIRTVAVYSEADACAPHVRSCDQAVMIGPAPVQQSYLSIDAVLRAADETGADAVHPGYGLLSENPEFAARVGATGRTFVGPSPSAMEILGDKVRARERASQHGLPPPPGTGRAIHELEDLATEAERIGYPVVVKAAAGGGGIGMTLVAEASALPDALQRSRDRARSAFGDERIYLEKYLERPRHIELQLLRDRAGHCLALGDRECSVQRRHQKVIEEAPAPASFLDPATRSRLTAAARDLLASVDYVGAATMETVADANGDVYFLEVNARLQVEHPVTELCTGVDLVELQLRVAAGETIPEADVALEGHAIEARLYAEDPLKGFIPQPGSIELLEWPKGEGIRVDAGVEEGSEVTHYYDPLLAKVCAHGASREEARQRLMAALEVLRIELVGKKGPRRTNLALLRDVLANDEFRSGTYDTGLLDRMLSSVPGNGPKAR